MVEHNLHSEILLESLESVLTFHLPDHNEKSLRQQMSGQVLSSHGCELLYWCTVSLYGVGL